MYPDMQNHPNPSDQDGKAWPSGVRVLLAGGGTGGHLYPALAVAEVLRQKGAEILFAGTRMGLEAEVVPRRGFSLTYLWLSGLKRGRIVANLLLPLKVLISIVQSFFIIKNFRPQVALGTGGYACGPILLCAAICRVPILLQEQNSYPGVTTRLLARFAREVFLNFEEASRFISHRTKHRVVGNPVRPGFKLMDRQAAVERLGLDASLPTLLVFGGSQGAMRLNQAVGESLPELGKLCNLIWSRGRRDTAGVEEWTGPGKMVVKPFIDDMPIAYAAADLAVCRSGAMTLSELQSASLPAILIPFPHAAGDHQRHNAAAFARLGGALVIEDRDFDGRRLLQEVRDLLMQRERLQQMRQALARVPSQDTAGIIAEELLSVARER